MGDTLESLAHLEARIWWVSCDLHEKRGIDNKCAQRIGPSPTEASILWSTIQHGWIISVDFSYFFLTHWRILYYPFQEIYDAPNNGTCGKNFWNKDWAWWIVWKHWKYYIGCQLIWPNYWGCIDIPIPENTPKSKKCRLDPLVLHSPRRVSTNLCWVTCIQKISFQQMT